MPLRPNTIKCAKGAKKSKRRKGRGNASGRGNYSGRGLKGQKSRSGGKSGLKLKGFKPTLQSTPKLRGFKSLNTKPVELSLTVLERNFNDGDTVDLKVLIEKKLIKKGTKSAKVLGNGELKKKLTVIKILCTGKATEAIKSAGGEVKSGCPSGRNSAPKA
ncbi:MAG: 50S ribosomal protein L15 [bacterium]